MTNTITLHLGAILASAVRQSSKNGARIVGMNSRCPIALKKLRRNHNDHKNINVADNNSSLRGVLVLDSGQNNEGMEVMKYVETSISFIHRKLGVSGAGVSRLSQSCAHLAQDNSRRFDRFGCLGDCSQSRTAQHGSQSIGQTVGAEQQHSNNVFC